MKCESCNLREATIHISKGNGFNHKDMYLCEVCANQSFQNDYNELDETFNIHQLLKALKNQDIQQSQQREEKRCTTCGAFEEDIIRNALFGCSDCYHTFPNRVQHMVGRVQSNQKIHVGRVPKRAQAHLKLKRDIEQLEQKLQTLVETQNFEEAVVVRDKINALKGAGEQND